MDKVQAEKLKASIRITGLVQGVGFRPFVSRLAGEYGINGFVKNESGHVLIEAVAPEEVLFQFMEALKSHAPKGSLILSLEKRMERPTHAELSSHGFYISKSSESGPDKVIVPPDIAVCDDCLKELFSPGDPRFGNPFISCTHCGPRFSIIRSIPYDRANTTMQPFPLCPLCSGQYNATSDRRCHAQTVCCNQCGPKLCYKNRSDIMYGAPALEISISALMQNKIIAVKGIGGYHLCCSPFDAVAVTELRHIKAREHKPFAVMFPDIEQLRLYCELGDAEKALITNPARPIVLLKRKPSAISERVYTSSLYLGAFLPYTPLQHLILRRTGPLIMTSANTSSLPIIINDEQMLDFFDAHKELDGVLLHDRKILRRLDDSVAAVIANETHMVRRARGYVPLPLPAENSDGVELLACGSQEKNTFSLYKDGLIYASAETGDIDSREAIANYAESAADMQTLLGIKPSLAICDKHPGYESSLYAKSLGLPVLEVQHHYAHVASVMAEHNIRDNVIGVAFDGTGYGEDGTIWGGEFLISSSDGFVRAAHIKPVKLFASDESVRQGRKTALCFLYDAGILPEDTCDDDTSLIHAALDNSVNTILSSSMGRVFDAVSSILGICHYSGYDGQCAIELENTATGYTGILPPPFPFDISEKEDKIIADLSPCIREIYCGSRQGESPEALAYRFHITVCELVCTMCIRLRTKYRINKVALSGGVFSNRILVEKIKPRLCEAGFEVYFNNQFPAGDGCVSVGQTIVGLWSTAGHREEL